MFKKSTQKNIKFNPLDWLCFAISTTVTILALLFYHENPPFYIIMSVIDLNCGVISMILKIKGYRINYLFAFIEAFACFYISWSKHFIGNALVNILFSAPVALIGFYAWGKHSDKNNRVIARKFSPTQTVIAIGIFIVTTLTLNLVLITLGGTLTLIDSAATILLVIAILLSTLRFREQWVFWLLADILQLIMWTTTNNPAIITLRIFFPLSAIYGYINWRKLIKKPRQRKR